MKYVGLFVGRNFNVLLKKIACAVIGNLNFNFLKIKIIQLTTFTSLICAYVKVIMEYLS